MTDIPTNTQAAKTASVERAEIRRTSSDMKDSADRRTELAADRTVFAAERTYAAWVRTGLAALASGVGARALLTGIIPDFLVQFAGSVLVLFSAFCLRRRGVAGANALHQGSHSGGAANTPRNPVFGERLARFGGARNAAQHLDRPLSRIGECAYLKRRNSIKELKRRNVRNYNQRSGFYPQERPFDGAGDSRQFHPTLCDLCALTKTVGRCGGATGVLCAADSVECGGIRAAPPDRCTLHAGAAGHRTVAACLHRRRRSALSAAGGKSS